MKEICLLSGISGLTFDPDTAAMFPTSKSSHLNRKGSLKQQFLSLSLSLSFSVWVWLQPQANQTCSQVIWAVFVIWDNDKHFLKTIFFVHYHADKILFYLHDNVKSNWPTMSDTVTLTRLSFAKPKRATSPACQPHFELDKVHIPQLRRLWLFQCSAGKTRDLHPKPCCIPQDNGTAVLGDRRGFAKTHSSRSQKSAIMARFLSQQLAE